MPHEGGVGACRLIPKVCKAVRNSQVAAAAGGGGVFSANDWLSTWWMAPGRDWLLSLATPHATHSIHMPHMRCLPPPIAWQLRLSCAIHLLDPPPLLIRPACYYANNFALFAPPSNWQPCANFQFPHSTFRPANRQSFNRPIGLRLLHYSMTKLPSSQRGFDRPLWLS